MTPFPSPAPVAPQTWIDAAYARLEAQSGFRAREAQKRLSSEVAISLMTKKPLAAEAPTGTGKTLAYLIGALAANQANGVGVVVSTATKALQQQLLSTDLPRLVHAGMVQDSQVTLAKGRSNYLCLRDARTVVHSLDQASAGDEEYISDGMVSLEPHEVEPMVDAFESGRWSGDFDMYEGARPRNVISIAASSDTCSQKKCEFYKDCAYFKARKELVNSKVVVVNHDLLLIDLHLATLELDSTLALPAYSVVFDEAHHLPEKALKVGTAEAQLSKLQAVLPKLGGVQRIINNSPAIQAAIRKTSGLTESTFDRAPVMAALRDLLTAVAPLEVREDSSTLRFKGAKLPTDVEAALASLILAVTPLSHAIDTVVGWLKTGAAQDSTVTANAELGPKLVELTRRLLDVKRVVDELKRFDKLFESKIRKAMWLYRKEDTLNLVTAPLEGADVLDELLWKSERVVSTAMVSATLRDLGGFDRFKRRVGLPVDSKCVAMPYTFDYKESQLIVADMSATPKFNERQTYLRELRQKLPEHINPHEATLLLFPSWSMLREFTPLLREKYADKLRVQGDQVIRQLVRSHTQAIDNGEGSVLAGVATLAEGLDLPGKYCMHVVIMALPFAVPTDPVEEELSDLLGKDYFSQRSLPDAMVKLTQMVGRLLRRESDRGRVTIFDRRLASTSYGQKMLHSLPPFKRVIQPLPQHA